VQVTVPAAAALAGRVPVPGDKSLGHRALLWGALRRGVTTVHGLGGGADLAATAAALRTLGLEVTRPAGPGAPLAITGYGFGGLHDHGARIDCGNSGTSIRLLIGLLAGRPGTAVLDGDDSLRRRPMERVAGPLRRMGANITTSQGTPPVTVAGARLHGTSHTLRIASAQLKSALLLAGLQAEGRTSVTEPGPSRDHTERALARFGAPVGTSEDGRTVWVDGPVDDLGAGPLEITVPGDPSSAAFLLGAALVVPGSDVRIDGLCLNPGRIGAFEVWRSLGADLDWNVEGVDTLGEPVGWARARSSALGEATISGETVVRAIDEIPILAATAAAGGGKLTVTDAAELRVKESDRLATVAAGLRGLGASVTEQPDGFEVISGPLHGARVDGHGDHRVAMSFYVAGLAARGPVEVTGWDGVATSYPEFLTDLRRLGLSGATDEEAPA
jgi:3-phosphoshikimate 1-carboxyvinyltransferase